MLKRQWLYNKDGGVLFESPEAIAKAKEEGYVDTPAKVDCKVVVDDETPTIVYAELSIDELKEQMTVKEMKTLLKHLGITGMSRANEDILATALYEYYHPEEEL